MAAEEILKFALFKEVLKPERRKRRKLNTGAAGAGAQTDDEDASDEEMGTPAPRMEIPQQAAEPVVVAAKDKGDADINGSVDDHREQSEVVESQGSRGVAPER
jgi:DNA replication licensing factor MCM3